MSRCPQTADQRSQKLTKRPTVSWYEYDVYVKGDKINSQKARKKKLNQEANTAGLILVYSVDKQLTSMAKISFEKQIPCSCIILKF